MLAAPARRRPSARSSSSSSIVARARLRLRQHPQRASRGRLRDRAGRQPQAVPRRRGARGPQARPRPHAAGCSAWSSSPSACRSTGWPSRAGRTARSRTSRSKFVEPRRGHVRHHRGGRLQLRRLPRRQEAERRRGRLHAHRRRRRVRRSRCNWKAPALNTVLLRYSREEVRYILTYGRPFSPMPAWGVEGGGPLNDQQIQNLIDYLESDPAHARGGAGAGCTEQARAEMRKEDEPRTAPLEYPTSISDGEAHLQHGLRRTASPAAPTRAAAATPTAGRTASKTVDGSGALGPPLRGGTTLARFPGAILGQTSQTDFVCAGSEQGKLYGRNGQGTGRMPGFGSVPGRGRRPARHRRGRRRRHEASRPRQGRRHADRGAGRADRRVRAGPLTDDRLVDVLAAITWDPGIRGILVVVGRRARADAARSTCCSPPTPAPGSAS